MTDMSKQTEALKLALEALEWINRVNAMDSEYKQKARESLNAIYEALAEQPAHQHIEHCLWARNGNQPCPHVQPAQQQEPVAVVSGYYGGQCVILPIDPARIFNSGTVLYTSPQAQRTWVGLTDDERLEVAEIDGADEWFWKVCKAIEAKLKEKNT